MLSEIFFNIFFIEISLFFAIYLVYICNNISKVPILSGNSFKLRDVLHCPLASLALIICQSEYNFISYYAKPGYKLLIRYLCLFI